MALTISNATVRRVLSSTGTRLMVTLVTFMLQFFKELHARIFIHGSDHEHILLDY